MTALAGAWDLTLEGSHRKCRVTLAPEAIAIGHALRFPAGCRKALPVLKDAGGWSMRESGTLRLIDAMGEPALEFCANGRDKFVAGTAKGETYRLEREEREEEVRLTSLPPNIVEILEQCHARLQRPPA